MSKDTATEQPVEEKTLADEIALALEAAESTEEETEEVETEEEEAQQQADEDTQEEESEEATDEAESEEEDQEPAVEPPQHWATQDKEMFANVPREAQDFLLRRHKEMEADYTRKTQEVAETRKKWESVNSVLTPYRDVFARQGLDEAGAVRFLVGWKQYMDQDPRSAIMQLARDYGVDLAQQEEQGYADPAVAPLYQEINQLKAREAQRVQLAQQAETNALVEKVNAFRDAKDAAGNPAHPHFETVKADMAALIQGGKAMGLDDAYEMAIRLNPNIYDEQLKARILQEQKQRAEDAKKKADDDKRKKVATAKKAATGVRSGSASVKRDAPASLRDELASQFDKAMGN